MMFNPRSESRSTLEWFKSSYSSNEDASCVEAALEWTKSSYSNPDGPDCVEIAPTPSTVHIRDSKNPSGPTLQFTPSQWDLFVPFAAEEPLT